MAKKVIITEPADEETELEHKVDLMMDPAMPEEAQSADAPPEKPAATPITIVHHDEVPVPVEEAPALPSAPPVEAKVKAPAKKKPLAITVEHAAEPDPDPEPEKVEEPLPPSQPEPATAEDPSIDALPGSPKLAPEAADKLDTSKTDESVKDDATEELVPDQELEEAPLRDTLDEPQLNKAVDDIVAKEGDELLAVQDAQLDTRPLQAKKQAKNGPGLKPFLTLGLSTRLGRRIAGITVLVALIAGGIWPASRYAALNAAGVTAHASLTVIDQSTYQPLKNVAVELGGQTQKTDDNGKVSFNKLRLGPTGLTIEKRAFAPVTKQVTIGYGSNPLGDFSVSPVGNQYAFVISDYLSGKPIATAAASSEQADAAADDKGKIKLTLEQSSAAQVAVTITAPGYRNETLTLDLTSKLEIPIKLVPSKKVVYVSKRTGNYDVYASDIDGKNEIVLLPATGSERDDMIVATHPNGNTVAVVATRDNKHNKDGYLLSSLVVIDLATSTQKFVTTSEQINLVGWADDRLVYVQIASGASAADPNRQRLMSYDFKKADNKQLTSTNYFNDVLLAGGNIFYAPSSTYQATGAPIGLFRQAPDGSNKQTVLGLETWNIVRSDYETLIFSVPNEWYDFKLGAIAAAKLNSAPPSLQSRVYVDSPNGKKSLWTEVRDGKGALLIYDVATKKDTTLLARSGLRQPMRWLNDSVVVFRVADENETADYALSLDGGDPVKIRDVTSTGSIDRWYYY